MRWVSAMREDPKDALFGGRARPSVADVLRLILAPDRDVDIRHTDDWCGKDALRGGHGLPHRPPGRWVR